MQKDIFSPRDILHEDLTQFSDDMHDTYVNMDDYEYYGESRYPFNNKDQMDWDTADTADTGPLTPVPGFGFFPKRVNDELNHMTQVRLLYTGSISSV